MSQFDDTLVKIVRRLTGLEKSLERLQVSTALYDVLNENTPAQITSNQNNYSIGEYEVLRLSSDTSRNITGFSGGVKGRSLTIINVGSNEISLVQQSVLSSASNRIVSSLVGDILIRPNQVLRLYYDSTTQRWRV